MADGQFILQFNETDYKNSKKIAGYLKKSSKLKRIVQILNNKFKLSYDIVIKIEDDDDIDDPEGPFYDEDEHDISLTYQYILEVGSIYFNYKLKDVKNGVDTLRDISVEQRKRYLSYMMNVTYFDLFHEVAHALIDMYDIPVLGNEEEAADNLAVIISLEDLKGGFQIVLDEANSYQLSYQEYEQEVSDYWDEHNLDIQRYYDLLCLLYGRKSSKLIKSISAWNDVDAVTFLIERKGFCEEQYESQRKAWLTLLKPYLHKR